jgi:hypothetical protein
MSPRFVSFENNTRVEDSQVGILPEISLKQIDIFGLAVCHKVILKDFLIVHNDFAILCCAFLEGCFFVNYSYFASENLKKFNRDST